MTIPVTEHTWPRDALEARNGTPVVLNLGCGTDSRGVGVDINYDPDIEYDLNDGIPVDDDAVDEVLAEHVLEHLDNPTHFFAECRRVIRPGGTLSLEVPNAAWLPVRLWITQDIQRFWSHKDPDRRGHWLARKLGNTDERRTAHRTLWTKQLLSEYLDRHGFDYEIDGWHGSRNLTTTATVPDGKSDTTGRTLHELERSTGDDMASQDYWAQTRARILSAWIRDQSPKRVLDAGCGSGYLTALLARESDANVVGVDISRESVDVAQRRDTTATFRVDDVTQLSEWADEYDAIIFADVLEHFEDPTPILREARDALAPGGSIYVSLPAHEWLWGPHDEHNDHHHRFNTERLRGLAVESGLRLERARYTNAVPLLPYWFFQRVLKRPVPDGARGGHNRVVEAAKRVLLGVEERVSPPVGVTLIGELKQ